MHIRRKHFLSGLLLLCGVSILVMLYRHHQPLALLQTSHTFVDKLWKHDLENQTLSDPFKEHPLALPQDSHKFVEKLWKHEPKNTTLVDPYKEPPLEHLQKSHKFVEKLCKFVLKNTTLSDPYKQPSTVPSLDPWDPSIRDLVNKYPPLRCKGPPILVYREDKLLKVDKKKVTQLKTPFHHCIYKTHAMINGSDFDTRHVFTSKPFKGSIKLRPNDTDIVVDCFDVFSKQISKSFHSFIFPKPNVEAERKRHLKDHVSRNDIVETPNVLMIGMDGMSTGSFIRLMPKTRQYLIKDLQAIELKKHNVLGENTIPNILPLLTGRPLQYYERNPIYGSWRFAHGNTFDKLNKAFIWNDFEKAGYRTAFAWERKKHTPFHYNTNGWIKRYVDYTNRATAVRKMSEPTDSVRWFADRERCINDITDIQMVTGYLKEMATVFNSTKTPYFGYTFLIKLSHDSPGYAMVGDQAYMSVLKEFKELGLLHNTVLIFFSDHGPRFGEIRATRIGSLESSLPMTYFAFPEWFRKKYPEAIKHLLANSDRLTTHFDTYETIKDLLFFGTKTEQPKISKNGISLIRKHPEKRSCWEADIPLEFCVGLGLKEMHVDPDIRLYMGQVAVNFINNATWSVRSVCERVQLSKVDFVYRLGPVRSNVLTRYRFGIHTNPNNALYEVTMECLGKKAKSSGDPNIISMILLKLYGSHARCVEDRQLKFFCQCM